MMMIFIWQRRQATRKGTSPSMLAARTKNIICKHKYIISIINVINNKQAYIQTVNDGVAYSNI